MRKFLSVGIYSTNFLNSKHPQRVNNRSYSGHIFYRLRATVHLHDQVGDDFQNCLVVQKTLCLSASPSRRSLEGHLKFQSSMLFPFWPFLRGSIVLYHDLVFSPMHRDFSGSKFFCKLVILISSSADDIKKPSPDFVFVLLCIDN